MKVGIIGGTFDPIHLGHIQIAQKAYEQFNLDKVIFMPSGISYLKKDRNVSSANDRLNMVKLAVSKFDYFETSTLEIDRGGDTYTYETLEIYKKLHPFDEIFFILGADSLLYIDKWIHPELIYKNCTIICAVRDDSGIDVIKSKGTELSKSGAKILYLDIEAIDISSTKVREKASKKQSIDLYVPKEVENYILKEHLYEKN